MGAYDCDCIENILSARRDRDCAEKPSKHVGFIHGALADPYEKQAREHSYTLGDKAELMEWTVYDYQALGAMPTIVEAEGEEDENEKTD